jgi:MYXO-CTERM domain-containing protein
MLFLTTLAIAGEVLLRNDTNTTDTYDGSDQVAWLEFPECAVSVLTADADDLPMDVGTIYVYLGSNTGNQDGTATLAEVGIQLLDAGGTPVNGGMDWGPEAFSITVSSQGLNALPLVDTEAGWSALSYASGSIAVWVCTPDETTGESWPRASARDTSGIVIDVESPSAGNYLWSGGEITALSKYVSGSWIIRAGPEGGTGIDTGSDTGGDTGGDSDTDDPNDSGSDTDAILSVSSITPADTVVGEPVSVAIIGTGFAEGLQVYIGGLSVSSLSLSGNSAITATSPSALPAGVHDLVVQNAGGGSSTLRGAFTVTDADCGCRTGGSAGVAWLFVAGVAFLGRRKQP